jgi:hypothetical protein
VYPLAHPMNLVQLGVSCCTCKVLGCCVVQRLVGFVQFVYASYCRLRAHWAQCRQPEPCACCAFKLKLTCLLARTQRLFICAPCARCWCHTAFQDALPFDTSLPCRFTFTSEDVGEVASLTQTVVIYMKECYRCLCSPLNAAVLPVAVSSS